MREYHSKSNRFPVPNPIGRKRIILLFFAVLFSSAFVGADDESGRRVEILFLGLGHNSHQRLPELVRPLGIHGINFTYTEDITDINSEHLAMYDGLLIYSNITEINPAQEKALLDFVESGKGLIALHCASYCFLNSPAYISLVGGQFKSHGAGVFAARIALPDHPIMKGFQAFESWDETYVHTKHNEQDRTVLMYRDEGGHSEPWTWVRTQGKGRVFYTASGHDERTWQHPGFHDLVLRGIKWAIGDEANEQLEQLKIPPLKYEPRETVQNYEKRDPRPQYQFPLSPEESRKHIQIAPGFELALFAAEPEILKPMAMAWDARGRLWIVESVDYPNQLSDDQQGNDRIKICEDTDGDGRADKFTVFADRLNIPTSITMANDGVIVTQAPHFLFLKDTDGDDIADVREIIFDGWATFDTHAGPSSIQYGLDNYYYGSVGYAEFDGQVNGKKKRFERGIFRFLQDGSSLEFIGKFTNNTWGLGFSESGEIFGSTANDAHSMIIPIPIRYYENIDGLASSLKEPWRLKIDGHYEAHPITEKYRQVDVFDGFTSAAGHRIYTARAFPKAYWNRVGLVCEPTVHLLHNAIMERDKSAFREVNGYNLMAGSDAWFSPVQAEVGPDGAVWVLDWYNFIIQHNPNPREDWGGFDAEGGRGGAHVNPLRDKQHGRIWRVSYKGAKPYAPVKLSKRRPQELVSTLKNDNMFWRLTAQRLLVERDDTDISSALYDLVRDQSVDDAGINGGAIHALWTMHGLGLLSGNNEAAAEVALSALQHPSFAVRKNAAQVIPRDEKSALAIINAGLHQDADLLVQRNAFLSLSEMPPLAEAGAALFEIMNEVAAIDDRWLTEAYTIAAIQHSDGFLRSAVDKFDFSGQGAAGQNLLPNSSFEIVEDTLAADWQVGNYMTDERWIERHGLPTHTSANAAHSGDRSIEISSSAYGSNTSLYTTVTVDSNATYLLSGWIKTENVAKHKGWAGQGALLNVEGMGFEAATEAVTGSTDWTRVTRMFRIGKQEQIRINLLFGGWGLATGKAWYDDVALTKITESDAYKAIDPVLLRILVKNSDAQQLENLRASLSESQKDNYDALLSTLHLTAPTEMPSAEPGQEDTSAVVVQLGVINGQMKFDLTEFTVPAGSQVKLVFSNTDQMLHNVLISKPGTLEKVGGLADLMLTDPRAFEKNYVPESDDILFFSKLVQPGEQIVMRFQAPESTGDYPYICTFPAHWRIMNGIMKVR